MENRETPTRKTGHARVLVLGAIVLLALVIIVPPYINVSSLRRSIVQSIGAGLGRPVYASAVELTLFPRPAFVLHHLTVAAESAFGYEPVITAETVTASLRASTLWHRRVEIASLHFDAPSVNLVRNDEGQWNFASLLRNSPVLRLPGGASSSSHPLPFPYVEATEARINFKLGAEKLPFSLESADLAFWKESGNEWHVRIRANPVRTDLTIADTGQIRGEASVTTSAELMNAPIRASLEWRRVQLGEFSRLLHGKDSGWRGNVDWTASAQGTLAKLLVDSDIHVDEFRRAEFVPPSEMDLAAHCHAQILQSDQRLNFVKCDAPLGNGHVLVSGNFSNPSQLEDLSNSAPLSNPGPMMRSHPEEAKTASVQFTLQHVSAGFLIDLLRHIHPGIAAEVAASGEVNGDADCRWVGPDTLEACKGELSSTPLTLSLPHLQHSLHLSPLVVSSSPAGNEHPAGVSTVHSSARRTTRNSGIPSPVSQDSTWSLAPTHVSLEGPTPATVSGTLTGNGPTLGITGAADLTTLYRLASAMNIPVISGGIRSLRGSAQLALSLKSTWLPPLTANAGDEVNAQTSPLGELAPSQWSGRVTVHNATLQLGLLPGTIQIAAAQLNLTPASVEWNSITGSYAHIPFDGNVGWQIFCPAPGPVCARNFMLHTPNLNVAHLQAAMHQNSADSGLLERMNPWAAGIPEMPEMSGVFNADSLSAGKLSLKNVSLQIRLQGHHASLVALSGALFGGTLSGLPVTPPGAAASATGNGSMGWTLHASEPEVGSIEWGDGSPVYMLGLKLENIQPDAVARMWSEKWGTGDADIEIHLKTRGWSAKDLAQNASGNFSMEWNNGSLAVQLPPSSTISPSAEVDSVTQFQQLDAEGTIHNQALVLSSGRMALSGPYPGRRTPVSATQLLSGTVTFSRLLNLRLQPSAISITGPLDMPIAKAKPLNTPSNGRP